MLLSIVLCLNTGCKKSSDVKFLSSGLSFVAVVNKTQNFNTILNKNGEFEITDENNTKYIFKNDSLTVENYGLSSNINPNSLPKENIPNIIYNCFKELKNTKAKHKDNEYFCENESFVICFTSQGIPLMLKDKISNTEIIIEKSKIIP